MPFAQTTMLDNKDLSDIRDAVPSLDLLAIRSLRRAGFQIVRQEPQREDVLQPDRQAAGACRDAERPQSSSF